LVFNYDKRQKRLIYIALFIYWLILLAATSLPSNSLPDVGGGDKIKHFTAYLILTVLLTLFLLVQDRSKFLKKYAFIASVFIASLYGIMDELHQALIPGRSCEFMDWVADVGGAVTGSLVLYLYSRIDRKFFMRKG
jgi:VanZ family protein